jgi:hypothetical protein
MPKWRSARKFHHYEESREMELCELAAKEQDSGKLRELTAEIIRLLDEKRDRLRNPPATASED